MNPFINRNKFLNMKRGLISKLLEGSRCDRSVDFYFRLSKISFQVFDIMCLLELKGEVTENVHILLC